MHIDVIIDTVCPWCYIGLARFRRALDTRPQQALDILWRPFQLNPAISRQGQDRHSYLLSKFGTAERSDRVHRTLAETGEQEGISFNFDAISRTPNTVDSHRLIAVAADNGLGDAMVERLFRAYFVDALDIGEADVLADLASEIGLDRQDMLAYLKSDRDVERILAEDEAARGLGVNGVPCYIIDRKYAVSGAQSPEIFHQIFELARQDAAEFATS